MREQCGIVSVVDIEGKENVVPIAARIASGLQHRGELGAGIATARDGILRVQPRSRAGFTFYALQQHVLPALSRKAGVRFACMSAIHACMLANDHPHISAGRSTEWRSDTIGESHAVISGRSDRGPIRYLYYDVMSDPYINRGFRLCVPLSTSSDTEPSS